MPNTLTTCPRDGIGTTDQRHVDHCIHCGQHFSARTAREWASVVRMRCPRCNQAW